VALHRLTRIPTAIHVGAAAESVPEALVKQLKPGGTMLIPVPSWVTASGALIAASSQVGPQYAAQEMLRIHKTEGGEVRQEALLVRSASKCAAGAARNACRRASSMCHSSAARSLDGFQRQHAMAPLARVKAIRIVCDREQRVAVSLTPSVVDV
jgi:hypothetical protein